MAYIGRNPTIGNFVKLDAITATATTTFNLLNGGVAYFPQSPNHCLVSLNGILQAPTDSFTISGSTIIFSSALTTSDVIDFIIVLGDVLNIGTPSDNTVSLAKLTATGTKDATTFLRGDNTFSAVSSDYVLLATVDASSSASVSFDGYFSSTYKNYILVISGLTPATDNTLLRFRVRQSNADVTSSGYGFAFYGVYRQEGTGDGATVGGGNNSYAEINYNQGLSNTAGYGLNGRIYIHNPLATEYRIFQADTSFFMYDENYAKVQTNLIRWSGNNTALSGFSLYMSSGNITSGSFKLYGLK